MRIRMDFSGLPLSRLARMARAGEEVLDALRVLGKGGTTLAIHTGSLINKQLVAALALLGVIAVLPVFFSKRRQGTAA